MSSCTECHGAEGNRHTSNDCPRWKKSTPPTEKLYTEAEVKAQCVEARIDELKRAKRNNMIAAPLVHRVDRRISQLRQQQDKSQEGTE